MCLVANDSFWWLPVAVIAFREISLTAYRSYIGRRGISLPARWSAKVKTVVQEVAVGFALPVHGDAVTSTGLDVPVHAVCRDIELPADEPLRERRLPLERGVPFLVPLQPARLRLPEAEPVAPCFVVGIGCHVGVRGQRGRRLEAARLGGEGVQPALLGHEREPVIRVSVASRR